jgi:hypothetical protein
MFTAKYNTISVRLKRLIQLCTSRHYELPFQNHDRQLVTYSTPCRMIFAFRQESTQLERQTSMLQSLKIFHVRRQIIIYIMPRLFRVSAGGVSFAEKEQQQYHLNIVPKICKDQKLQCLCVYVFIISTY